MAEKKPPTRKLMKLDPEFKAQWLKALRSGRYEQGKYSLRTKDDDDVIRYCCLGVACNILDNKHWKEGDDEGNYNWGDVAYGNTRLPFIHPDKASILVSMNDDNDDDFAAIADYIEKKL